MPAGPVGRSRRSLPDLKRAPSRTRSTMSSGRGFGYGAAAGGTRFFVACSKA